MADFREFLVPFICVHYKIKTLLVGISTDCYLYGYSEEGKDSECILEIHLHIFNIGTVVWLF